jgi:ribosomal protein S18 acetylase RimI-like enzyme
MSAEYTFRPATPQDAQPGAALILETLHQFGDHMFGFSDHARAQGALERFFAMPRNRFSFQYAQFLLADGEIAGILVLFNRRQMRRSMAPTALQLPRVYSLKEILKFMQFMLPYHDEERLEADELYIAHLAVAQPYRRQGLGLRLLEQAEALARAGSFPRLSLLTEIENAPAQALYTKFGMRITQTIRFAPEMHFVGSEGDVRMEKNLT